VRKGICTALLWLAIIAIGFFGDIAFYDDVPAHIFIFQLSGCALVILAAFFAGQLWEE
jgi:hypothetical protein